MYLHIEDMQKVADGICKELDALLTKIVIFDFETRKADSKTIKDGIATFLDDLNRLCEDMQNVADSYRGVDRTALSIETKKFDDSYEFCAHALASIKVPGQ